MENETTSSSYNYNFKIDSQYQKEYKIVRLFLEISIQGLDDADQFNGISAGYTHEFVFHVDNLEELVEFDEEKKIVVADGDLGITLAGIAYSTARGIIFDKTQGTLLKGLILPIISPNQLLSTP
ncbi:hypothetical protein [[Flexibacter] sp. ATCC 35208]|uniref:hypothetical protein n=1 Tax=[Flexibacter] sp. ATCC 35208 TaxID=1936242 RepID=UPI0009D3EEBF|nr:hypothetical protein [[Flexibacter] sp. ATCC 35208]OMP81225.1 hypothetical protein BW716_01205 [[Flexibacter] sp. ATCC 35208]